MKINLFARGQRARLQRAYSLSSPSWQFEDSYRVLERLLSLSDAAGSRGSAEAQRDGCSGTLSRLVTHSYTSVRALKRAAGIPAEPLLSSIVTQTALTTQSARGCSACHRLQKARNRCEKAVPTAAA